MPPIGFQQPQPQTPTIVNPVVASLFKSVNSRGLASNNYVRKGSLITFSYQQWIHDPYPLLMVTDILPNNRIRGINMHYLTFPYIKTLLRSGCSNLNFSYANIKGNAYITNAFRSYKWNGIRQVKLLDCNFLLNVMATVRSFDPSQVKAIRQSIQEQIKRVVNPKAVPSDQAEGNLS